MSAPPAAPLLLHIFPGFGIGGAQVRLAIIANHFGPRWRHAVLAMDGNQAARARLEPALAVSFPALALTKGATFANLLRIRAALRAWRPARLVTHNWGSIEWALANRAVGLPHLHIEDGFGPEERDRQIPRRVRLRRIGLARATLVVPSQTLARLATEVWRLDPARVRHVPNGIDPARFDAAAPESFPGAGAVIGTVAALRAEKAIGRLIGAFARLADRSARLVIIGDGPERAALQALAAERGVAARVVFAGHRADPASCYRGFDLFALSSDTEQMPLSVLEAMAARLPVAATDVGDVAAMLAPENRALVVPRDEAALAGALATLLADAASRRAIGAANRARVEAEYGLARMLDRYAALYDGSA